MADLGTVQNEEALALVADDLAEFQKYLYYTSAKYVKRLDEPKNEELLAIVQMADNQERAKAFNQFTHSEENLKKLQRVFPIYDHNLPFCP